MKRTMKKMLSFGLVAAMSLTMLAGCGNSKDATNDTNVSNGQEEKKPTGDVKIGVLVQDVSGEEALGELYCGSVWCNIYLHRRT